MQIVSFDCEYEVAGNAHTCVQHDFIIDGESLGELFGLSRPWFGQTCFDRIPRQRSDADEARKALEEASEGAIQRFLGRQPPQNQFGTDRLRLFGCHCGCDYCGLVSSAITRDEGAVHWTDIRWEDGAPDGERGPVLPGYRFERAAYDATVAKAVEGVVGSP